MSWGIREGTKTEQARQLGIDDEADLGVDGGGAANGARSRVQA
ncbi:hypothetical protein [Microbispora sp. KK1-11]|nr:hypothetical protein [Microbispora sp. KK1-11]